ncbi:MAG: hypothetical protein AABW67_00065 [Nanoarchaeota archaeon]
MAKHEKETIGREIKQEIKMIEKTIETKFKLNTAEKVVIVIGVILLLLVFYNTYRLNNITGGTNINNIGQNTGSAVGLVSASEIMPSGVPKIYGKELGISYNDISASNSQTTESTIGLLTNLDNSITLTGSNLERYVKIGSMIACEYCCGATTLVFKDGQPACGCAHSYAMRGVAKYIISKHGTEFTDDEILEELGKWKVLFFPEVHQQKASALKSQGIELNYINLASNKYRGIEKGQASGGEMVGGC